MTDGLAAFDMDGTLLDGRLVFALARRRGLETKVREIQSVMSAGTGQTQAIASLFAGVNRFEIEDVVDSIPLAKNCENVISELKKKNYKIGIISDSYRTAAERVAKKLGMDFVGANELEFIDGVATGRVHMPMGWEKNGCFCKLSVCKRYHLEYFAQHYGVDMKSTLAVGDTRSDICMVKRAGVGLAFMPKDSQLEKEADATIRSGDLAEVLLYEKIRQTSRQQ